MSAALITMAQAKRDVKNGWIVGADIVRPPMWADTWIIQLRWSKLQHPAKLVDARTKQIREFKTLDAAFRALEQMGLRPEALQMASPGS